MGKDEDYVLVPREPTNKMLLSCQLKQSAAGHDPQEADWLRATYKAMLAATPPPQGEAEPVRALLQEVAAYLALTQPNSAENLLKKIDTILSTPHPVEAGVEGVRQLIDDRIYDLQGAKEVVQRQDRMPINQHVASIERQIDWLTELRQRLSALPAADAGGRKEIQSSDGQLGEADRVGVVADTGAWPVSSAGVAPGPSEATTDAVQNAVAEERGWQPIETSPKNTKVIAGYFNAANRWRSIMATYYAAGTLDAGDSCDDPDADGYAPEGWYEESESYDELMPAKPTHWRPMPEPPRNSLTPEAGKDGEPGYTQFTGYRP